LLVIEEEIGFAEYYMLEGQGNVRAGAVSGGRGDGNWQLPEF
jgi:hypothetical protein